MTLRDKQKRAPRDITELAVCKTLAASSVSVDAGSRRYIAPISTPAHSLRAASLPACLALVAEAALSRPSSLSQA